jgi:hypothetical protein
VAVHFVSIEPARDWGASTTIPLFGALTGTHVTALLNDPLPELVWLWHFDRAARTCRFTARRGDFAVDLPMNPMHGTVGVAPAMLEVRSALVPDAFGGNMDTPEMRAGSTCYLGVNVEGALLSLGDGHARQGEGETCGVAVETRRPHATGLSRRAHVNDPARLRHRPARSPDSGHARHVGPVVAGAVRRQVPARPRRERTADHGGLARRAVRCPAAGHQRNRRDCPRDCRRSPAGLPGGAYQIPLPGGAGRPIRSMVAPAPVPIYLAALGPRNLELTGELADGWIGNAFIPEPASAFVDHLQAGASRAGRSLDGLDLLIPVSLEITDDVAEAAARHAAGYAFTIGAMGSATQNFYNAAFSRQGFAEDVQAVQQLWLAGKREEAAARVPRDIGFKTNLIGPPEIIRDRLRLYRAAGVTTLQVKSAGQGRATLDAIAALIDLVDEVNREGQPRRD